MRGNEDHNSFAPGADESERIAELTERWVQAMELLTTALDSGAPPSVVADHEARAKDIERQLNVLTGRVLARGY